MRLTIKYGLVTVFTSLLTAASLAFLLYQTVHTILKEQAKDAQYTLAQNILHRVAETIRYAKRDMQIIAQDEFLKAYVERPESRTETKQALLLQELQERAEYTGPWGGLIVVDRNRTLLLSTSSEVNSDNYLLDKNMSNALDAALAGEIYQSPVIVDTLTNTPSIIFSTPLQADNDDDEPENEEHGEDGGQSTIVGVMIALYQWPAINKSLENAFERGSLFLLDKNHNVIAEHVSTDIPQTHKHSLPHKVRPEHTTTDSGIEHAIHPAMYQGESIVTSHVLLKENNDLGWSLIIEETESSISSHARKMAWLTSIIVLGVMTILTIVLTFFGYRLLNPLSKLTIMTQRIGEGDFSQRLKYPGKDEVGQLTHSINTMCQQLEQHERDLIAANNRIQSIINTIPEIFYAASPSGLETTFISDAASTLLGYSIDELISDPALRLNVIFNVDKPNVLSIINQSKEEKKDFIVEYRVNHKKEKGERWFEDRGNWSLDQSGNITGLYGVMSDITERKTHEQRLAQASRELEILHSHDKLLTQATSESELLFSVCKNFVDNKIYPFVWIGIVDREHPARMHVSAFASENSADENALSQLSLDTSQSQCLPCKAIREEQPYLIESIDENTIIKDEPWRSLGMQYSSTITLLLKYENQVIGTLTIYSKDARKFDPNEIRMLRELINNLSYGIMAIRTQKMHDAAREQLAHQAFHDEITGLPNRVMLMESLQREIAHADRIGECLAVLFVDLDEFKLINDTLGHQAGDSLLRKVAERLRDSVRGGDIVSRQGGDEFIIIMTDLKHQVQQDNNLKSDQYLLKPAKQAERILEKLKQPYIIGGQKTYVGASIGISIYPYDAQEADLLLRFADTAMYKSKDLGRGIFSFYSAELTEHQNKRISLANNLHAAVDKNQFRLYYQPVINLASGKMTSVEALIRWQLPTGEIIPPGDFLPVAEDTGLIIPIGDWVISEACRQINVWKSKGFSLGVAVNLSIRQMWQGNIAEKILDILRAEGIKGDEIELEITESAMSRDMKRVENIILNFHRGGLRIALDDFGTGYSSLSRLKQLPIHTLKIDKSFVDGIPENNDDMSIVTATIHMAHSLGLTTLAEGIETNEQLFWLQNHGCQYGQGYFFSRPVPAEEIDTLLNDDTIFVKTNL